MVLRVLDLFSCIGCHHIGLQRAGGFRTVLFCEIVPFRQDVLSRMAPEVPIASDVRSLDRLPSADVCFGGPPCTSTSKGAAAWGGRDGTSLWPEMFRAGTAAHVTWFVVEQPPGHEQWESQVFADLAGGGFALARLEYGACDLGAPYIRRRVFILACSDRKRLARAWGRRQSALERTAIAAAERGDWNPDALAAGGVADGPPERTRVRRERIEALGDSNPPAMAEVIGRMIQEEE